MDHYIYYRVDDADTAALEQAVAAMQASLRQEHGVTACLKRRPATDNGPWTYMEVYENAGPSFGAALEDATIGARLQELVIGPRHAELFEDISPCA